MGNRNGFSSNKMMMAKDRNKVDRIDNIPADKPSRDIIKEKPNKFEKMTSYRNGCGIQTENSPGKYVAENAQVIDLKQNGEISKAEQESKNGKVECQFNFKGNPSEKTVCTSKNISTAACPWTLEKKAQENMEERRDNVLLINPSNSVNTEELDKDRHSGVDKVCLLLKELGTDTDMYNDVLGKLYAVMKQPSCDEHDHLLINDDFLNKMDIYLQCCSVITFKELRTDDEQLRKTWPVIKKFLTITWVVCDRNVNFCQYMLKSKVFLFLLSELSSLSSMNYEATDMYLFVVKAVLGILHNISRHVPNSKWNIRNEGMVTVLRKFLPSHIPMIRLKTLIILSYILNEAENEIISSDDDNFVFIFQVLSDSLKSDDHRSKKYGMNAFEVLKGINNLAINDENKIRIVRNGALPVFETILATDGFADEKKVTIMTLWSLSFHHFNRRKMREMPGIMGKLSELQLCEDKEISHAARGTFWELENTSKSTIGKDFSSSAEKDPNQPHIMISYQWDSQPMMIKVKDRLRHAGYKVWMDVEHMTGSTLEAMALAVEKAAVVLICMSQKYKDSPNCRTEAEYVYRLRKDFVPLRLQCEYIPDGWLGILVGTRLYFDMYSEETFDVQLPKLVKELRERGRISPTGDLTDSGLLAPQRFVSREAVPLTHVSESMEVRDWDSQHILDWLTSMGVEGMFEKLSGIDGSLLLELQKIQEVAPECFYSILRGDFKLSMVCNSSSINLILNDRYQEALQKHCNKKLFKNIAERKRENAGSIPKVHYFFTLSNLII